MIYKLFHIKFATPADKSAANTCGGAIKSEIISTQQLLEELHKPIIRKFEKYIHPFCDLADMKLINKRNSIFIMPY